MGSFCVIFCVMLGVTPFWPFTYLGLSKPRMLGGRRGHQRVHWGVEDWVFGFLTRISL